MSLDVCWCGIFLLILQNRGSMADRSLFVKEFECLANQLKFNVMKKIAIIFGLSMAMTVTLANAQIKVTSSNVQIGNGLDVGTSEITVHHPVQIGMYTLQEEGTQDVTFGMGKYGLQ